MRGYLPVELPFYKFLNWDMDLSILCLEVFRIKLPTWIKDLPKEAEYDLISLENPHGPPYPAIGIYCKKESDFDKLPSFIDLFDQLEALMTYGMIEEVLAETSFIEAVTWDELKEIKTYTKPVRHKSTLHHRICCQQT